MITKGESMIPVTKIDLKDKDGTVLNTEKKYCRKNILVLPKLNPLEVTDHRDGRITAKMGKLTPLEEAYEIMLGGK